MTSKTKTPADFDLTCWYINKRRVMELVGSALSADVAMLGQGRNDQLVEIAVQVALKDSVTRWLKQTNPPTLGQLLLKGKLQEDTLFTHYSNFFCKGLMKVGEALYKGKTPVPMAEAYSKLDFWQKDARITFPFSHEHLTSTSAWSELSGQKRLFVLGKATDINDGRISAIPWLMAYPVVNLFNPATAVGHRWQTYLEVTADSIDSFSKITAQDYQPAKKDLEKLRTIPEQQVKKAFAEIIGEAEVPKDWGGERSDLLSDRVVLDGKRISTAFAFKGPAKFGLLTIAGLGKNGDQIDRLFSEPVRLLVLQHCHEIAPAVRGMMRAYAQQMGNPRLFCLINGYDTLRILRAYKKCGI